MPRFAERERAPTAQVYRVMKHTEQNKPQIGNRTAAELGARTPASSISKTFDVEPDAQGMVGPGRGMSVSPGPRFLPVHLTPRSARHIREGAMGKECNSVWKRGEGAFVSSPFAPGLLLTPDQPDGGVVAHGEVGPESRMAIQAFQDALASTQDEWLLVHKGRE